MFCDPAMSVVVVGKWLDSLVGAGFCRGPGLTYPYRLFNKLLIVKSFSCSSSDENLLQSIPSLPPSASVEPAALMVIIGVVFL